MRHVGDLLKELGFNKDAPLETQKAFLKHLVKAAEQPKLPPLATEETATSQNLPQQLSLFDLLPPIESLAARKSSRRSA